MRSRLPKSRRQRRQEHHQSSKRSRLSRGISWWLGLIVVLIIVAIVFSRIIR